MHRSEEDYLKTIFELSHRKKHAYVSNRELASYFELTIQAVNEMVKKLDAKGYLRYVPYKGCQLTDMGIEVSLALIGKHRLWEVFLVRYCGYRWDEVHDEAEQLEHATSLKLFKRLHKLLDAPKTCPHGNPIPDLSGNYLQIVDLSLLNAKRDVDYRLTRVVDNQKLLSYLAQVDLKLGDVIRIVSCDEYNQFIIVSHKVTMITMGFNVARSLFVNKMEDFHEKN